MRRDEELVALFQETFDLLKPLLSCFELSEEELAAFAQFVYGWFDRFSRRPGNETIPVDQSRVLVDRLTAAGHPSVTYLEIADRGHNALSGPTAVPLIARIAQFLSGPDDVEPAAELVSAAGAAITPYGSGRR